jgi:creatinine amidohydrolase/Fe(II)-dependent formamide hydrolase-like protein
LKKLQEIRLELLDLNEERDLERREKTPRLGKALIVERLAGLRELLSNLESEKQDGKWRDPVSPTTAPRGQAVLEAVLNECWVLVAAIQEP